MDDDVKVLDVVALTEDIPDHGLVRGQVGTVVETLAAGEYEVEFCGDDGRAYALLPLSARRLIVLKYQPAQAA
jgi:membrane protein implicated in regulation of membrane protease activity